MANEAYSLQDYTTLDLETSQDTPTSTPVAGVTNVEITPTVSIERLYTGDTIKIEDQLQHEFQVPVTIEYMKFDPVIAEQWLGGEGGTSANSMTDTSKPQKYSLTGDFESRDGTTLSIEVSGITFPEMPLIAAANGEYAQWGLEGTGEDITDASTA